MNLTTYRRSGGFSLIELMVSVVIGLLALVFATRLFASSEQTKANAIGSSDAMQNGMQAMFSISQDVAQAGWGLNDPLIGGCNTVFYDSSGFALPTVTRSDAGAITPMAAVVITSNGNASDSITLMSGNSLTGTGSVGLALDYVTGASLSADRVAFGFSKGDAILVVPDNGNGAAPRCALAELTETPAIVGGLQRFDFASGTARYNRPGGLGQGYTAGISRVFNLGPSAGVALHTWSLSGSFLQLRATNLAGSTSAPQSVIDNVVSLKAQYGFDKSATFNPELGMQIQEWSPIMIDADGDSITAGPGDFERIAALRLAIVARSRVPERPKADGTCVATLDTEPPKVFVKDEPKGVTQPAAITPTIAMAGDTLPWTCYRYRVFETIVPMRNMAWRPTAGKPPTP